jgi:hypothetical protein
MVLISIEQDCLPDLPQIAGAFYSVRSFISPVATRKKRNRQQGDQDHDNEQVGEAEASTPVTTNARHMTLLSDSVPSARQAVIESG